MTLGHKHNISQNPDQQSFYMTKHFSTSRNDETTFRQRQDPRMVNLQSIVVVVTKMY